MGITRREAITRMGLSGAALLAAATPGLARAGEAATGGTGEAAGAAPAFAGRHEVVPLPFKAGALDGISEKLITSHHDNNYAGAVKNLNKVEAQLAAVDADTPPFVLGGLMQSALTFANSKALHEAYFGNLGGDGKADGPIAQALAREYGSLGRWESLFRATGVSLGGGSGWVILAWDVPSGTVRTAWSGNHTMGPAASIPLLVMDLYEHAYQMDYGAGAAKYIEAFFRNVKWDEVNRRFERARR